MADKTAPTGEQEPPRLRKRWGVNLALLAVVVALAAFTIYQRQQEKTELGPPLTALAIEAINRVHLERPEQAVITLAKQGEHWRLTAPVNARANRFNVDSLLRVAGARSELRLEGDDAAQYGLTTPQARLQLDAETFEFGALHPFRPQVYVRHRGTVHLVSAQMLSAVLRAPNHFIDARLLEPERRLVGLRLPGFALDLKDGRWQHQPPAKDLASDRIGDFVAQWTNAHALSVEPATARPALASLRLIVTRESAMPRRADVPVAVPKDVKPQHTDVLPAVPRDAKPETLTLDILAYKPTFVLRRRDEKLEYHFPEEIGKRLLDIGSDG